MQLSYKAHSEKLQVLNQNEKTKNKNLGIKPTAKRIKVFAHKKAAILKQKLLNKKR